MDTTGEVGAALRRRLGRIERLRGSSSAGLLRELRLLVPEAEAWARAARPAAAPAGAAPELGEEVEGMR